jgi:phosphonate dehydrogenase
VKRPRIIVTNRIHADVANLLAAEGDLIANPNPEPWPASQLLANASEADALMVFMPDRIDEAFLSCCPRLKVIAAALKGYDNFDVAACARRGIWFTIVPDLLTEPTAELALSFMLAVSRNLLAGDRYVRSGRFRGWRPTFYGRTLHGSTVGILGYGAVGKALALLLQPFHCRLLLFDVNHEAASLSHVLAESDYLLTLLPLTPSTLHFLNAERLRHVKYGCVVVNVGRGSLVDEQAIADALESGHLGGYAADTFEMEDWARTDRPSGVNASLLASSEKTLFTPHLGSAVAQARLEIERAAALSLIQALRGEVPAHAITSPVQD